MSDEGAKPIFDEPAPRARRYGGKRFLLIYFVGMILVLLIGMWMTWTLAGVMTPALKAKQDARLRKDKADRAKAREQERTKEPLLDSKG
ncbi:MAG: hypothetical protein WAO58_12125 [Fimbriimonadaceae bacterium]